MLSAETFATPPARYRPIPFWFWNSRLRPEQIRSQIRDFHSKGLGGFFIHARFGLETPYLSRQWMECVRTAVSEAAELGLEVWLYDENGFPSGTGDLKVSRIPEFRPKFIDLTECDAQGGESVDIQLPPGSVVLAVAFPQGKPGDRQLDLTDKVCGQFLRWTAPEGRWRVAVFSRCVLDDPNDAVFGVDYLNPDAMRYFFDLTLEPYREALGEYFGSTIKGIFTDEPTLLPWHHDINWYGRRPHTRVIAWSDRIEDEMTARTGLTAQQFLPHIFFDVDDSSREVRRAFRRTVSRLYEQAFFEPYARWCAENGLKLTGHVLFEEGLFLNTEFQADITRALAHFSIPGTDHLGAVTETPYGGFCNTPVHLTNLQGEKLVASVAHSLQREAVLSETYGCAGWGLTFEQMKRIADWQFSLGINMLCPHALFYSIEGFRKSDAPASHNHMTGWRYYRGFADYIGRLSYILRQGKHRAKVALFYPLEQFWGEHITGVETESARVISDSFDICASALPRIHRDYDIISERDLADAEISDGRLSLGGEEYEVIIASPDAVTGKAAEALAEFLRTGGKLIVPPITRQSPTPELLARSCASLTDSVRVPETPADARHIVLHSGVNGSKVIAITVGTSDPENVALALETALRESTNPDVEITSAEGSAVPDVRYVHRTVGSADIYFVTNTSEKPIDANIRLETAGHTEVWDPETGKICDARVTEARESDMVITHTLPPFGSVFLVVHGNKQPSVQPGSGAPERSVVWEFGDEWQFQALTPNALVLDDWSLRLKTHGAGADYTYETSFSCEFVPSPLLLMLDDIEYRASLMGGMDLAVEVNDSVWHNPEFGWYLDHGFKTLDISSAVRPGENTIRILIRHSAWSGQPHVLTSAAALLGDFACDPAARTLLMPVQAAAVGSWTEIGYPFFSGTAIYRQSFRVAEDAADARFIVEIEDVRDMVEIAVNGESAGVRLWRPWQADVTALVRPGHNVLELEVTNSMQCFLEASPRESGLIGRVRLIKETH